MRDLSTLRRDSVSKLTPQQRRLFDRAVDGLDADARRSGLIHKGNALKSFVVDEAKNGAESFKNQALLHYRDATLWQKYTAAGQLEVRALGDKLGWGPEKRKEEEQNFVSDTVKQTALRIAQSDPLAAEKYMKEKAEHLTAADMYSLEQDLKVPMKEAQSQRAASDFIAGRQSNAGGSAFDMIARFEGFRTAPYWDVNHWRLGFGSDTVTREDGRVEEVKPGMTVTQADATRDLQRRIAATQSKIAATVGQDKWDALSAPAKAAVSSVAYNYGTTPSSVADAIRTGGPAEIAAAIRGLEGHNDGVNKKRRNQEADAVLGIDMGAAGRDTRSFFTDMESYLATIKDPQVQELTRKRINAMLETQHKADEATKRQAKAELWNYVDKGMTPDQIPMQVRQAAGMEAVSSAWSYMETVRKGRDVVSDEEMLYGMRRTAAQDPEFFSRVDLNDYRDKLSRADLKELQGLQTSALTDQRKAREDGLSLTAAFSQAEQQLAAVGITTTGKKGTQLEEANKRIAQFNNALSAQMDEFKRANSDRKPTQADIQSMINRLLLPVVIKTPGTLFGTNSWAPPGAGGGLFGKTKTFAFDAATRPDNATVEADVKYSDIPIDLRRGIAIDLERDLGRKPSDWEVVHRYNDFILNRGPTPIRPRDHGPVDRMMRAASEGVAQVVVGLPAQAAASAIDWFKNNDDHDQERTR
ncbi:lysozyme [Bradyrhizobium sp. AZCC 1708]|uniref:lysozyme n=1 Tax=Bradyrhizobium sp. AZCC 1708 TaxID=3117015 RepID=UPI002FF1367A